ncbi:hypothetical protein PORCAN_1850 [Porphyromonas crevioricanis JCM 13913]|nr:hypothetical protein PORCAN_1850 [Porphyromonas crevioricanis JCM 13913]
MATGTLIGETCTCEKISPSDEKESKIFLLNNIYSKDI